jgi:transposase
MARMVLGDAQWAALMLVIQRIPHAWRKHEPGLRLFVEAALWIDRTGAPWRDLPGEFGQWASVYHRFRRWSERGWWSIVFEAGRPVVPKDGLAFADSTPCKAHRSSAGAARSRAEAECFGRSRGGLSSKIHACVDGDGTIMRLIISPGHHADLRYAAALLADSPATDAALDRGYVSATLRQELLRSGCTIHTPPKKDMVNPPPWDTAIYARRHLVENVFSRLKDFGRIALRRDKTRRSWLGFIHLASAVINLRLAKFSHTA